MTPTLRTSLSSLALAAGMACLSGAASAGVVDTTDIVIAPKGAATFTMTCTSCSGLTGYKLSALSDLRADAYEIGSASEANLAAQLSALLGLTGAKAITKGDVAKFDVAEGSDKKGKGGGLQSFSYNVDPGFFFAKFANYTSFFHTDTAQKVTFTKTSGGKGGLSNYSTIAADDVPSVPLPAAGWLLLAGIGGMAALRRRKA